MMNLEAREKQQIQGQKPLTLPLCSTIPNALRATVLLNSPASRYREAASAQLNRVLLCNGLPVRHR